jgi:sugar lactone lactonase YvrE
MSDAVPIRAVSEPCLLGESPMWHPGENVLYWCDIPGCALHRLDPRSGASRRWDLPCEASSCAPMLDGGLLLAMRDGLWRFDPQRGQRSRLAGAPYDPARERFNDGKCDPQGRYWVGTIYEPRDPPLAALYCWDGRELKQRADGITVSNGLAWSPDGGTMYWADTKSHTIWAFDFDGSDGSLSRRRVLREFPRRDPAQPLAAYGGRPDGAAVDAQGCYWVAMYEGQRLLRLSPQGELLAAVELPVRCPTMPCFGGPDLRTLYVTTAREGRSAEELAAQPLAGAVLSMPVEVPGLPASYLRP